MASINQNGTVTSEVWSFTTGDNNPNAPWYVYRGNARPEAETGFFDLNTAPVVPTLNVLFTDPDNAGNSIFGYRSDTEKNFRWRFDLSDQDSTITIVARIRGIDDNASGMMHLDVHAFGWRKKVRLNSRTIKFERSSPTIEEDLPFNWNGDYHIVRLVVNGRTTTVYLDEDTTPFISGESNDERDQLYFEWGKSGSADYGAYVDWMAVNITEASAPTEGTDLPTDIILGATSTFDPFLQAEVRIYPNPAARSITVELPTRATYTAQLISMDGRSATGSFPVSHLETVDVSTLPKGFYVLVVQSESGQLARTKLLID